MANNTPFQNKKKGRILKNYFFHQKNRIYGTY